MLTKKTKDRVSEKVDEDIEMEEEEEEEKEKQKEVEKQKEEEKYPEAKKLKPSEEKKTAEEKRKLSDAKKATEEVANNIQEEEEITPKKTSRRTSKPKDESPEKVSAEVVKFI